MRFVSFGRLDKRSCQKRKSRDQTQKGRERDKRDQVKGQTWCECVRIFSAGCPTQQ